VCHRFWASEGAGQPGGKELLRRLLDGSEIAQVVERAEADPALERKLNALVYDTDKLIRWRAVHALAVLASVKAQTNLAAVREKVRRLFWAMNDESGNSLPHAPELAGELLARVPALIPEFIRILPSFSEDERYRRGVHWAMWRLASVDGSLLPEFDPWLIQSLADPDPCVRSLSILTLGGEAGRKAGDALAPLLGDPSPAEIYDVHGGVFRHTTVAEIARSVLG
jgi:AraC family transcriptional regulator of adaptative response/methylated-DNA-[protein]-cysteine methyltransferase